MTAATRTLVRRLTDTPTLPVRYGVVTAVNSGTVDVTLAGSTLPGVSYLAPYLPALGDTVVLLVNGSDVIVLSSLATAPTVPTFVSGSLAANAYGFVNSATVTGTLPSGLVVGNVLVGIFWLGAGAGNGVTSWTTPTGWTLRATRNDLDADGSAIICTRVIDGTETNPSTTATCNALASFKYVAVIQQYSGVSTTAPFDQAGFVGATTPALTNSVPSLTPAAAAEGEIVAFISNSGFASTGTPAGLTSRGSTSPATGSPTVQMYDASLITTAATTAYVQTYTSNSAGLGVAILLAPSPTPGRDRATIYDNAGGQNITATAAAVTLAGETVDAANGHPTTVGTLTYTLQTAGPVSVSGCLAVTITGPPASGYVQHYVTQNGSPVPGTAGREPINASSPTGPLTIPGQTVKVNGAAGDTFRLMAVASGTFTTCQTISSGSLCSSLTIELETMT